MRPEAGEILAGQRHLAAAMIAGVNTGLDCRADRVAWAKGHIEDLNLEKALELLFGDVMEDPEAATTLASEANVMDAVIFGMPKSDVQKMWPITKDVFRKTA